MSSLTRRRFETTLLSYSRQCLPRPARLYSTPTKSAHAPALATSPTPSTQDYSPYLSSDAQQSPSDNIHTFLKRRTPYTVLPMPLPEGHSSPLNDYYFPNSPTQDMLSVIDACLHNTYDVPRAKYVFEQLRSEKRAEGLLHARVYNLFLEAYLEMATSKEPQRRDVWLKELWSLYEDMESGKDKVYPTTSTYAIICVAWLRFNIESESYIPGVVSRTPANLLRCILGRELSLSTILADRIFSSSDEALETIRLMSRTAVEMGHTKVVMELGQVDSLGRQADDPLEGVPEVIPVKTIKRHEMEEGFEEVDEVEGNIPFNLDNLRKHLAQVHLTRRLLSDDAASRQKLLEESVYDVAVQRLRHQAETFNELGLDHGSLKTPELQTWMWHWHEALQERLKETISDVITEESKLTNPGDKVPFFSSARRKQFYLGPFLSLLKPEKLSLITILELMRIQGSGGVADGMKTARALVTVGKAVEIEHKAEICRRNNIHLPATLPRSGNTSFFTRLSYRDLHARRVAARKYMEDEEEWTADWTQALRVRVGSFLIDHLIDIATVKRSAVDKRSGEVITEDQPAFFHTYEYIRGHKLGVLKLNPVVAERIAKDGLKETLHPRHLPMLVKPKPWTSHDQGGYLYNKSYAMRYKDSQEQLTYLRQASVLGNVELVFAGLDVLGSTPWKINRAIFDIVLEVWNSGERLGKLPPSLYDEPEPEKPDNYHTEPAARSVYQQRLKQWVQDRANNHSDRCNVNYKIEIARAFLGDTMYQPHNLDFRGRAYPIPPHLNHIGDDLSRGLLVFGESRALGERGLRWLKIHLANLYGYDKGSFDERVHFVMEHLDDIYDSAERPLEGRRWWTKADDPWQCLATCIELHAALESGNPLEYQSSLPVHQDGTCNGLQHYAALGGDDAGAKQVNLDVTDRPSDVYTYVAEMVEAKLLEDVEKGNEQAMMLSGKVSRKVVKQTVMTTVYGVTFIGAREQIEKQLKDRGDIPIDECWKAASYLAKQVIACIGDLFSGAKDIQNWLNQSARLISKSIPAERIPEAVKEHGETLRKKSGSAKTLPMHRIGKEQMTSVVWTTPLGLPIVQPYRKVKRKQIMTSLQTIFISDPNVASVVNAVKQASAFPPNFIHSLDATHMMLTALECRTEGLTFASVHDSYWTHASTIDRMSEIIRDTFIALHSCDVLGRLHQEFQTRYKDHMVPVLTSSTPRDVQRSELEGNVLVDTEDDVAKLPDDGGIISVSDETKENVLTAQERDGIDGAGFDFNQHLFASEPITRKLSAPRRRGRPPKNATSETTSDSPTLLIDMPGGLQRKFVDLASLLPPLPKKGGFDVQTIKKSQYFFS